MKRYHVTYYYLATGMEGRADTADYGIVEANSEDEAKDIIAKRLGDYEKYIDDKTYRHWGLTAKQVDDNYTSLPDEYYNESQYIYLDDNIIRWHITDDNELDYTIYSESDGGRLELSKDSDIKDIEELLLEEI